MEDLYKCLYSYSHLYTSSLWGQRDEVLQRSNRCMAGKEGQKTGVEKRGGREEKMNMKYILLREKRGWGFSPSSWWWSGRERFHWVWLGCTVSWRLASWHPWLRPPSCPVDLLPPSLPATWPSPPPEERTNTFWTAQLYSTKCHKNLLTNTCMLTEPLIKNIKVI